MTRCQWVTTDPTYIDYHDLEWGVPVHDDQMLFEFLTLETFQAGLSWLTVLKKRDNFRRAFDDFKVESVANYGEAKVAELLSNAGIIRNKLKIKSAINNAQQFMKLQSDYGSFDAYAMQFVGGEKKVNHWSSRQDVPAITKESDAFSKDLKAHGFKFVGSTVMYSHMQATGMVMDHTLDCFRYKELSK